MIKHGIAEIVSNRYKANNSTPEGVEITELLISRILKAQNTAIDIALKKGKTVKIYNFGKLQFNNARVDTIHVTKHYKKKGYTGDKLKRFIKAASIAFRNGDTKAISIKSFRQNK